MKTVAVDVKKLGDIVDNEVLKNTKFNTLKTKVNNLEKNIPDVPTLIYINQYNTDKQNLETKIGEVYKKIPDVRGLVTITVLNTKISEVENKIPNTSNLVTTTVMNTEISEVQNKIPDTAKYITTQEFTLTAENFAARLKQADLVNKTDFNNKLTSFNRRITSNKTKHLEVQKKLNSLIRKDYNFFVGRICFTSNGGSQNTFVYQPTLDALELKKDKVTDYVLSWKSKGVYNSKHNPLYTAFLHSIKLSEYRIGVKFDKDPLAVEQNNYLTKILNVYILNDLDAWPRNPTNNFKFKNCLFGATNIVKNSDKGKYVYSGYVITFDSAGSWSFGNDFSWNVIIFGVDNSSSSHSDNHKNNFLILGEGPTYGINGSLGSPEKKFSINFTKANTKFCLSLHYNADNSYLFVNGKKIFKFKADNKSVNFPTQFCLGSISSGFSATESRKVSLNGSVYDFSVDYSSIDKSDILNIHKYLMTKNNMK